MEGSEPSGAYMSPIIESFISEFGEDYREELEERISIMHIDGGLPESIAESNACNWLRKKYKLYSEGELFESTAEKQARGTHWKE
jgi:hypothetical protein